ncbi:type II CAAX endopeptidase family protein [Pseudarthrobacter oxydans]|uniref:CPBP family intramembrane glutamic endopeptidase n=1 Tax=Pseudarthrobacter oxydans TaxID=1671 RepID=UPI003D2CC73D
MSSPGSRGAPLPLIKHHPVAAFVVIVLLLSWTGQIVSLLLLGDILPGILAELLILLGTAILVTGAADGRPAVRELFRRAFRWRVAPAWYVAALLGIPALTVLIAAATGTFHPPAGGWGPLPVNYLLNTLIIGALLGNIWEELAWTGVVQHRIMDRHGPVTAALLTAIPFALIHLPFAFAEKGFSGTPWSDVAISWLVLFLFAPFFRLLMGIAYLGTGYSLFIVGLLHASFNASMSIKLDVFDGDWQQIAALILLLGVVAAANAFGASRLKRAVADRDPDVRTAQHPAVGRGRSSATDGDGPQAPA